MHKRDKRAATRRGWLRRTGGLVSAGALVATAGCLDRLQGSVDDDDPEVATDNDVTDQESTSNDDTSDPEAIPYDVNVAHNRMEWERYDADWVAPTGPPASNLEATTLAENLEIPWDLSFAPTGELFDRGPVADIINGDN